MNILVPDLSLFGGFNAEKWDITNNDVAVVANDDADNTVYEDGEEIGSLSLSEIPAFPCLVVKNNERMFVSNASTRADGAIYKFTDDAFNGELNRQTRHSSFCVLPFINNRKSIWMRYLSEKVCIGLFTCLFIVFLR